MSPFLDYRTHLKEKDDGIAFRSTPSNLKYMLYLFFLNSYLVRDICVILALLDTNHLIYYFKEEKSVSTNWLWRMLLQYIRSSEAMQHIFEFEKQQLFLW